MGVGTGNRMGIDTISAGEEYRVHSTSGNTYTVRYAGCGDGDPEYVALWECDCLAGAHGRTCKHVRAVGEVIDSEESYD